MYESSLWMKDGRKQIFSRAVHVMMVLFVSKRNLNVVQLLFTNATTRSLFAQQDHIQILTLLLDCLDFLNIWPLSSSM